MNPRYRAIVLYAAIAVIAVGAIIGTIVWFDGQLEEKALLVSQAQTIINRLGRTSEFLAELKTMQTQAKPYQEQIARLLPTEEQLIDFPTWIENIGKTHDVVVSVNFLGERVSPQGDEPGHIKFDYDSGGKLNQILKFLKEVEIQSPRFFVAIDSTNLKQEEGDSYRMFGTGRAFFRANENNDGKSEIERFLEQLP